MTYKVVSLNKGKSAVLPYIDGTIKKYSGDGSFIVMSDNNDFKRASKDGVFKTVRAPTNSDFEAILNVKPVSNQEKDLQFKKQGN